MIFCRLFLLLKYYENLCVQFLLNKLRQTDRIRTCTPCRAAAGTGAPSHSVTVRLRSLFCSTALRTFHDIL